MTVVPYQPERRRWTELLPSTAELANTVMNTDFVPTSLRGNSAAITAAVLYGDEVGLGPMQSLARIAVINGRPTLAAETQRALILQAGHDIWIEESTNTRCTVAGRRKGSEATSRVTWTLDDAKRANLGGKPPWRMYPRQMLLARASAELARAVFPDAIVGLAATEELEDNPEAAVPASNGAVLAPEPAPPSKRRRRANVTAAATTPDAPAPPEGELPPLPDEEKPEPEPEPPPEPEGMDDSTRKRMMMLFRDRGFKTSEERHGFASMLLGSNIQSSVEMTPSEAAIIIHGLELLPTHNAQ